METNTKNNIKLFLLIATGLVLGIVAGLVMDKLSTCMSIGAILTIRVFV
ncbi:hypothetical protein [Treponema sp. R6D11]